MRSVQSSGLFDSLPAAAAEAAPEADKGQKLRKTAAGKKPAAVKEKGADDWPDFDNLDPVIYGVRRPMSGEDLLYLRRDMGDAQFEAWKLRNLPLVAHYTRYHFTAKGQVELLRRRQYSDQDIARMYPALAAALAE